jgi:hypothetical protein
MEAVSGTVACEYEQQSRQQCLKQSQQAHSLGAAQNEKNEQKMSCIAQTDLNILAACFVHTFSEFRVGDRSRSTTAALAVSQQKQAPHQHCATA